MTFEIESDFGSLWHRWDPHIHTPGTVLNDQYAGNDPWGDFLSSIEAASPEIRALGITDYLNIDAYEEVGRRKRAGRLPGVGLIFPNVELRIAVATAGGSAINVHLLCSPEDADHPGKIRRFLSELEFVFKGIHYRCEKQELIRLGKAYDTSISEDDAALRVGTNQFKINFDQLRKVYNRNEWARQNILIAVAGGSRDGTSGLSEDSTFAALRKEIERLAHVIFSPNPKQRAFWLGDGAATKADLEATWGGLKPCLHGSDAHHVKRVGVPDLDRMCWVKGDLTFESLRQVCFEPAGRCFIGSVPSRGSLPSHTITQLSVRHAGWLSTPSINLNRGLVAVIGARGSGKTALADLVAAAAYALTPHLSPTSFVKRASEHLAGQTSTLTWEAGEPTSLGLDHIDFGDLVDAPRVLYLSQHFVEQLCSAEGIEDELLREIERVVFQAHPLEDRMGATSFKELLELRAGRARLARKRQQDALTGASEAINSERVVRDGLPALKKAVAERADSINKDKADRKALLGKGSEDRAKRLEEIATAADDVRGKVELAKRRHRSLTGLRDEVSDLRRRVVPSILVELQDQFSDATLSPEQWNAFKLNFAGDVDAILRDRIADADKVVRLLVGPRDGEPQYDPKAPPSDVTLIPEPATLTDQTLSLLEKELDRLRRLVGVDEEKAKKYSKLSEKISKDELLLAKLKADLERANGAGPRIDTLTEQRRQLYVNVFQAILDEEKELSRLYAPLADSIREKPGALGKLTFSVRRVVDIDAWAQRGEELLDLRKAGPFRGKGALLEAAKSGLLRPWQRGEADEVAAAMVTFRDQHAKNLVDHAPVAREEKEDYRAWMQKLADWLYSTDHVQVAYGVGYQGVEIERLSPGTRGIVLLLLYLAIDGDDDRPLVIDQPEENLDPRSIYDELVQRFREAKSRRQIIMVTHNANLVVNADADQVIVAQAEPRRSGELPEISYVSGGLENPKIRQHVCEILEGGERAFRDRAKRLRVAL
jgi:energy-coupling factor transporter ATP-binding protein EcfA2